MHRERLRTAVEKHDEQAQEALRQERDDLAKRALEKKHATSDQIAGLDEQIDRLQATQDQLVQRQVDLRGRIEGFRTHKEARAAALEELEASGALNDVVAEGDEIEREFERRSTEQRVDRELDQLKAQFGRESEGGKQIDVESPAN
jgi:phage shock protein A